MGWLLKGQYVGTCACANICSCPVDGKPTGPKEQCFGAAVFQVKKGNLDKVDLSGVLFAFYNHFPSNISAGNWKMGLVVDTKATDEQAKALEQIISGQVGGPFGDFVPLIGEFLGTERLPITFTGGPKPSASIGSQSKLTFEPTVGQDGTPTTIKGAPFAFAPEYGIGTGTGKTTGAFGLTFDHRYSEQAEYEYSDAPPPGAVKGRI